MLESHRTSLQHTTTVTRQQVLTSAPTAATAAAPVTAVSGDPLIGATVPEATLPRQPTAPAATQQQQQQLVAQSDISNNWSYHTAAQQPPLASITSKLTDTNFTTGEASAADDGSATTTMLVEMIDELCK